MKSDIIDILRCKDNEIINSLFNNALQTKIDNIGNVVYLRGLIEYSNICQKNCYYCGLRNENKLQRYTLNDEEVIAAAMFAYNNNFGSIVIQAGEIQSNSYTKKITSLLNKINENTNYELGITLSLGEQNKNTLKEWKETGNAIRYLLRIETSNQKLYNKIHPNNTLHSFTNRLKILDTLKELDYQVGTGIMIGLPYQTIEDLASDIIFFKEKNIDMIGMGPYIEHSGTPFYNDAIDNNFTLQDRLELTLRMIAILRINIPTINIAATTALQTITLQGRQQAINVGANIVMPNITPLQHRNNYLLYENKTILENTDAIFESIKTAGAIIGWGKQGNSLHFKNKMQT